MKGQKRPKTGLFLLVRKIIKSVPNHIFQTDLRWYYTHRSRENLIKKTIDK